MNLHWDTIESSPVYPIVEGIPGQHSEAFLTAVHTGTPTGDAQIWKHATGALSIEAEMLGALASGKVLILGWSETADDEANVISAINAALTDAATPDGEDHTGVTTITTNSQGLRSRRVTANTTIKTVVAKTDDSAGKSYVLRVVTEA